jgi:hypothetical protein
MLVHPIHFDTQTGLVSPLAFADAVNLDLSVFREQNASDSEIQLAIDEIRKTGASKVPKQERIVTLVMQAQAAKVRNCTFEDDKSRMCFVYDTVTYDKPNHASVFTPERATKKGGREVRRALLKLFSENRILPDNYRTLIYEGVAD